MALALALCGAPGCSDRACIQLSNTTSECPGPGDAFAMMTPRCGGTVISVDSLGDLDGDTCCYDVTQRGSFGDEPTPCAPRPSGPTGPNPASGVTVGVTTAVSSSVSSSSAGGAGGVGGTGGTGNTGPTCNTELGPCEPICDAPEISPSAGECVSIGGVVECNPVTNEGCDGAAGEACDVSPGGFTCYPAPNIENVCQPCGGGGASYCKAGLTCFGTCFRYCCKHSDCASGYCYKDPFPSSLITAVGVCIEDPKGAGGAGAGGAGGAG